MVPGHGLHHLLAVHLPREARLDHAPLALEGQSVVEAVVVHLRMLATTKININKRGTSLEPAADVKIC